MAEMTMVDRVAKAIFETWLSEQGEPGSWDEAVLGSENPNEYPEMSRIVLLAKKEARAAIEAMPLEQLIADAYVRGVEWNEENPLDREYRFKASLDYADKTLFVALNEGVAG